MSDTPAAPGPIDFLLLQFPTGADLAPTADAMLGIVEAGIVAVYDLLAIRKEDDGSFSGLELTDLTEAGLGGFHQFAGARSGLIGDEDLAEAAEIMEPGTVAVLLVYENTWASPFVAAARDAGAEVISTARIPAFVVAEVLDELEAADAAN